MIAIKHVQVIHNEGISTNHGVLIEGHTIKGIYPLDEMPHEDITETIDGQNHYLAPGFIDIHTHGNSGFDTMDADLEGLKTIAKTHFKQGVTSFLATTITSSKTALNQALKTGAKYQQTQSKTDPLAHMLGFYFEGPYFNEVKKGAQPKQTLQAPNLAALKSYLKNSQNLIKVVALAPELMGASELIKYLKQKGITVAMAHTDATYDTALKGIDAGITLATHMYNGMRGFTHREPGALGAALLDDRVMSELIVDGLHLHPKAVDLAIKAKGYARLVLISDAIRAAGLNDGDYDLGGQTITLKDNACLLPDGTLAGSTLNIKLAIKNLIEMNKIPLHKAIQMATYNPAKAIGLEDRLGQIKPGFQADLVFLNEALDVKQVIKAGRLHQLKS